MRLAIVGRTQTMTQLLYMTSTPYVNEISPFFLSAPMKVYFAVSIIEVTRITRSYTSIPFHLYTIMCTLEYY